MKINKLEIRRQIFHIMCGIVTVILINEGFLNFASILGILISGIIISILSTKMKVPIIYWFLERFEREKNMKKFPGKGVITYLIGTLIVYCLFIMQPNGKNIIMASIMILALGDSAPLFVRHMAQIKHPFNNKKFIEGAILGAMIGFMGAALFVKPIAALIASFLAMFVEGIEVKLGMAEIDDNIVIPLVAAVTIWFVLLL